MFYVYVLRSLSNEKLYTGQTENLERRIQEHNSGIGLVHYTKGKGPWNLVFQEKFPTRSEAMAREKYLKTGAGRDFLKQVIDK